tara:strand:+ start:269 stop:493 length:225 start_codon:yes stop_codon:yes gene_type:complete
VQTVRWVCPKSRGQLQALEKLEIIAPRRPREVDAGRIESFEGAPARNHGPGDRRGVIVDADDDDAEDDDVDLEL